MAKSYKFKANLSGYDAVRKSDFVNAELHRYASQIQQACGEGYVVEDRSYQKRNGVIVRPDTYRARNDNLKNNTLLKAFKASVH